MKVYAFKNTSILNSSSGAAFPSIINALKELIGKDRKLVVYGAILDTNLSVRHERIDNNNFECLRGSKYVLSNIKGIFTQVTIDLSEERYVLFSGTPCQIQALNLFISKRSIKTDYLLTVDILCHGTPSSRFWNDYKSWLEKVEGSRIVEYSFRYQNAKLKEYPVMAKLSDGRVLVNTFKLRQYIKMYFKKFIIRESCFNCKFANSNRVSDITIGDFWGIEKILPSFPFKHSVSEIIVNTQKGNSVIEHINNQSQKRNEIIVAQVMDVRYKEYQQSLSSPLTKPKEYDLFWNDYHNKGFEYVIKKYGDYNLTGWIKHIVKVAKYELK